METPLAPSSLAAARLLLVDGHALAYRSFHAIRDLTSPAGRPVQAVFGFIKALGRMRARLQPSHLHVVWDGGLAAERLAALPAYKAQRPPMPPSLGDQIQDLQRYLAAAQIASFMEPEIEADDWIATMAHRAPEFRAAVVIASSDKDFMQLVSAQVEILNPGDKSDALCGVAQVQAKTGVSPEQIVDWLSLIGDTVDNIGGVPGVGVKTATELLRQFGSVDALYGRLAEVASERRRQALQEAEPLVRRNQGLIRLRRELPFSRRWDELAVREPETSRLAPLYEEWGFKTLLAGLQTEPAGQGQLF